ncbi:MAG TPA: TetR/AcrR family transcriptional regulator [Burkholderiaceae bacterium]|nr:TetR/AcrR family transcriptional regulator [Burkholderiaceae bacterium]
MLTPSRLSTEERQAEIVAAALLLARDSSPASITTSDIATAIGVTQGAVFKHFPTKEAIWFACVVWVRARLTSALEDAAALASDAPFGALEAVFKAHVGFIAAHPGVPRLIFHELQGSADSATKREVQGLLKGYRKLLRRLLDDEVARGRIDRDADLDAAATLFVGIVQGLVMQSMASGSVAGMKERAAALFAIYERGLRRTR